MSVSVAAAPIAPKEMSAPAVVVKNSSPVSRKEKTTPAVMTKNTVSVNRDAFITHDKFTVMHSKPSKGEMLLRDLLAENASFVAGEPKIYPNVPKERTRLACEGQTPVAAVIACADSRVAPEIIFRANLGNLFVIRAAGNTAWGSEVLGSLEYAVDHLNVNLVMVLGHTNCGAVGAACAGGDPLPGALGKHITAICKGIEKSGGLTKDVNVAVERNVHSQVDFLRKDSNGCISVAEKNGLKVVGAVYDIDTGAVKVLDGCDGQRLHNVEHIVARKQEQMEQGSGNGGGGCSIV